jgi:hypothetical protein
LFRVIVDVIECQDNMFVTDFNKIGEFWILSKGGGDGCLMPIFFLLSMFLVLKHSLGSKCSKS